MNEQYLQLPEPPMPMPGAKSDEQYSRLLTEKKIENILSQLNPDVLIVEIEKRLKGYRKDEDTGGWELIGKQEKFVDDELLVDIMSILSSVLTNNTTMSNYQDSEINRVMELLIENMVDMLQSKAENYNLDRVIESNFSYFSIRKGEEVTIRIVIDYDCNYSERDRIMWVICYATYSAMKRAQNGLEAKRILDSLDIKENWNAQHKRGLDKLAFWK